MRFWEGFLVGRFLSGDGSSSDGAGCGGCGCLLLFIIGFFLLEKIGKPIIMHFLIEFSLLR